MLTHVKELKWKIEITYYVKDLKQVAGSQVGRSQYIGFIFKEYKIEILLENDF